MAYGLEAGKSKSKYVSSVSSGPLLQLTAKGRREAVYARDKAQKRHALKVTLVGLKASIPLAVLLEDMGLVPRTQMAPNNHP